MNKVKVNSRLGFTVAGDNKQYAARVYAVVSKADADAQPILTLTIQSATRDQLALNDFAENVIGERLQTIPGVSSTGIFGQRRYAMRLWIDPAKLVSYGLTAADIRTALSNENVELPSGKVTGVNTELNVNTIGNLNTAEQFNRLIIKMANNTRSSASSTTATTMNRWTWPLCSCVAERVNSCTSTTSYNWKSKAARRNSTTTTATCRPP